MLTRKHFTAIAAALAATKPNQRTAPSAHTQWEHDVRAITSTLSTLNPNFSRERFFTACTFATDTQETPQ